jgi:hypothetical protein
MSMGKIISSRPLTQGDVNSLSPAYASIASSLAGRVRYLYELVAGEAAYTPDGVAVPLNPQGKVGVDRSGPPWGDAHTHPLWHVEGVPPDANCYGQTPPITISTQNAVVRILAIFHCRPFFEAPLVPYSRGYLDVTATRIGGAGTATATVRIYDQRGSTSSHTGTLSVASATVAANMTGTPYCRVRPGRNVIPIEITLTSTTGINIVSLGLNQIVRRSH